MPLKVVEPKWPRSLDKIQDSSKQGEPFGNVPCLITVRGKRAFCGKFCSYDDQGGNVAPYDSARGPIVQSEENSPRPS